MFGIFGHGNVAGLGQALAEFGTDLPYYQPQNEQAMVHTASGFAKTNLRLATLACASPIGPGSTRILGPMNQARTLAREAFTHFAKKDFGDAIRLYREAIEHDASLGLAWNGLSMALAQSSDLAAAIEAVECLDSR